MTSKIWVLVADASRATVFGASSPIGELTELETFEHPESREHNQNLTTDLPGRSGHDVMDQKITPKDHEATTFAKELGNHIELSAAKNEFERLVLVAPPAFLGKLRGEISDATKRRINTELNKDLTSLNAQELREHLPERI